MFFGAFIAWAIGWWVLAGVGGQLPYFDSINFVISFIAQILYVLKYNENWSLWIFVNIANFLYWSILSVQMMMGDNTIGTLGANLSQVALQAALLFNAVYAQKVWSSGEANKKTGVSPVLAALVFLFFINIPCDSYYFIVLLLTYEGEE